MAGRGEPQFRAEMRAAAAQLSDGAADAAGPFLRAKLGPVHWFVTLTFDRRPGRRAVVRPRTPRGAAAHVVRKVGDPPAVDVPYVGAEAVTDLPVIPPYKALAEVMYWRKQLGTAIGRSVACLAVVEPHKSDRSAHAHVLVSIDGGPQRGDFELAYFLWYLTKRSVREKHGWIRIEPPRIEGDVCDYCSKYAFKDSEATGWRLLGRR